MSTKPKPSGPTPGASGPIVTSISPQGFSLLVDGKEYFLSFQEFPWFENATIREIHEVTRPASNHLRWATLDVDLALDSIGEQGRYPLFARERPGGGKAGGTTKPKPKTEAKAATPKRTAAAKPKPKARKPPRR